MTKHDGEIKIGIQIVRIISALPGGMAEKIIRAIAHPARQVKRHKRIFGPWECGIENPECRGIISFQNVEYKLTLTLGVKTGLFLQDCAEKRATLKNNSGGEEFTIEIGNNISNPDAFATNLVTTWVIHGMEWRDRKGKTHLMPYGSPPPENRQLPHRAPRRFIAR